MIGLLFAALMACDGDTQTVPGSALRYEIAGASPDAPLQVEILDADDCDTEQFDPERCYPRVLRSVDGDLGEVRVAFRVKADGERFPIPLTQDQVLVTHRNTRVEGSRGYEVELIPHDPIDADQLFILVIDGSGSMNEKAQEGGKASRMDRVRRALIQEEVVRRFFPGGNTYTGVALLSFTSGDPYWVGGEPEIVTNATRYKQKIREELGVQGGYTHLYNAVRFATDKLLKQEPVKGVVSGQGATPTIVVLTDGFNNEAAGDECQDNAPRLTKLMEQIHRSRTGRTSSVRARPTVYTVGLGRSLWPKYALPETPGREITANRLCKKQQSRRIDGDLEKFGIDNASLMWIAHTGGGESYVRTEKKGLGEAFASAAAQRYNWFEVRYRMDPLHMRRSFETMVKLTSYAGAEAKITFHPSGWFDPPSARTGPDGWAVPTPLRASLALLLPILGGLLSIMFLGAASYNMRRAIFRGKPRNPKV
jgi:hypothetical protein